MIILKPSLTPTKPLLHSMSSMLHKKSKSLSLPHHFGCNIPPLSLHFCLSFFTSETTISTGTTKLEPLFKLSKIFIKPTMRIPYLTLALEYSKNTINTWCPFTNENTSHLEIYTVSFHIKVAWLNLQA